MSFRTCVTSDSPPRKLIQLQQGGGPQYCSALSVLVATQLSQYEYAIFTFIELESCFTHIVKESDGSHNG